MQNRTIEAIKQCGFTGRIGVSVTNGLVHDGIIYNTKGTGDYIAFLYACDDPVGNKRVPEKTIYGIGVIEKDFIIEEEFNWVTEEQWCKVAIGKGTLGTLAHKAELVIGLYKHFGAEPIFGEPIHLATISEEK